MVEAVHVVAGIIDLKAGGAGVCASSGADLEDNWILFHLVN